MKKLLDIFKNKEKRIENLVFLLVLLIVTLLIINSILKEDKSGNKIREDDKLKGASLISLEKDNVSEKTNDLELEKRLETILSKIKGVSNVSVLITYSETEEIVPLYNINNSLSQTEEGDGKEKVVKKEESVSKNVLLDNSSNVLIEKKLSPKIEGAIVIAKGVSNINVKSNIISAMEAVTGLASHKIQVFEMGDE